MTDPLIKKIELLERQLLQLKGENKRITKHNVRLKQENKKYHALFVKIQGQVMRNLSGE